MIASVALDAVKGIIVVVRFLLSLASPHHAKRGEGRKKKKKGESEEEIYIRLTI